MPWKQWTVGVPSCFLVAIFAFAKATISVLADAWMAGGCIATLIIVRARLMVGSCGTGTEANKVIQQFNAGADAAAAQDAGNQH